ncbi:MAG TPA: alanine racemase [Bryobacteraceae bacterium]|nr:alanine racemase [Bryobacteraceae bacterium]
MHVEDLDTPALLIDLDIMERNLERMATYARSHNLRLRPHTKTHKIPELGRRQLQLGAFGLTVAKVSEAEVMVKAEPPELLIAFPVIGRQKLARLMKLAGNLALTVSLDSETAAAQLSEAASAAGVTIGVLAEIDAGLGRVGVQPGPDLVALAKAIERLPGLRFDGIAFYPGHIRSASAPLEALSEVVAGAVTDLEVAGFEVRLVSGGSTPTLLNSHRVARLNEIRPGTYIFNDRNTVECGAVEWTDCAASIMVTVVSTAVKGQMIVDGGSKTFSSDRTAGSGAPSFGRVVEAPHAVFEKMNEEHGFIAVPNGFRVGDRVKIIPNHICVAMNLHEQVYGLRGDQVETVWKVEGRGKLQ